MKRSNSMRDTIRVPSRHYDSPNGHDDRRWSPPRRHDSRHERFPSRGHHTTNRPYHRRDSRGDNEFHSGMGPFAKPFGLNSRNRSMWQLRVTNLSGSVRDQTMKKELCYVFRKYGDCSVYVIQSGDSKEAYITFWSLDEARSAKRALGNRLLYERPMEIVAMRVPKIFGPGERSFTSEYNSRGEDFGNRRRRESDDFRRFDGRHGMHEDAIPTRTLFVGNLDLCVDLDEIRMQFSRFGRVEEVDIKRPPRGASATYAFVKFTDVESAKRAKTDMEGTIMGRSRIRLGYGKGSPTTRVRVGGLGSWASLDWLEREFDRFGAIHHVEFTTGSDHAIVEFDSMDAAAAAAREMNRPEVSERERKLSVSFADPPSPVRRDSGKDWSDEGEHEPSSDVETDVQQSEWSGRIGVEEKSVLEDSVQRTQDGGKRLWTESEETVSSTDDGPDAKRPLVSNPGEKESLQDVARRFAVAWRGSLALRNMAFPLRMHLVGGDPMVAESFLRQGGSQSTPGSAVVAITQRLRLDPDKLDEVRRRVVSCGPTGHCVLLALPAPLPQQPSDGCEQSNDGTGLQFRALRNLVTYLKQKQAAGVATLERTVPSNSSVSAGGEASETCGALHAFPPSDFAREQLLQIAPQLSIEACSDDHLVILLVCQ